MTLGLNLAFLGDHPQKVLTNLSGNSGGCGIDGCCLLSLRVLFRLGVPALSSVEKFSFEPGLKDVDDVDDLRLRLDGDGVFTLEIEIEQASASI